MTDTEKLSMLMVQVDEVEASQSLLLTYLTMAEDIILNRLYPFMEQMEEDPVLPRKYHMLQVRIAAVLFNKRGAEGQTTHDENGVKRVYSAADVPDELLSEITPFVGRIGR